MEFCIISPTAGLERYAKLSRWHLVLAHVDDPDYHLFYVERREAGDFLILDNGAYENEKPHLDYELIGEYCPQVIVLPDYPLQPWKKTWHAAMAWLDNWNPPEFLKNTELLYIPQSTKGDLHGFIESYQEAASDSRITWLGIPRSLAYAITDNPLARVEFARMVRKDHPQLKLHAFGMVNGDVHELPYLAAAGVTSVDSSAPVWRGWNANKIDDQIDRDLWDHAGTPVDFTWPEPIDGWNGVACDVIKHNLEACGVRIPVGE